MHAVFIFANNNITLSNLDCIYTCKQLNVRLPLCYNALSFIIYRTKAIASIAPGTQTSGHKNETLHLFVNNTKMVQIFKFQTSFLLSLSEVQFFGECSKSNYRSEHLHVLLIPHFIHVHVMNYTEEVNLDVTSSGTGSMYV